MAHFSGQAFGTHSTTFGPLRGFRQIERLRAQLDIERGPFYSLWQDLADYVLPRAFRRSIHDVNKADRRSFKIINPTATMAARVLSAGMHGGVTSPSRPWFRLTLADQELAEEHDVKEWLALVTRRMMSVMLRTNLYRVLPILYRGAGVFGTAAIFLEENFETVFQATFLPLGSYWLADDDRGRANVFIREFRMTVRQLIEKFNPPDLGQHADGSPVIDWSRFSLTVRSYYDSRNFDAWIDVVHAILPNEEHNPDRVLDPRRRWKFKSVYYERGFTSSGQASDRAMDVDDRILRESGYDFFPVLAYRWETQSPEDTYGTNSPGITALGDIRQLQVGEKRSLQALEKMINPPMKAPPEMRTVKASLLPGDITYSPERDARNGFQPVYQVDPRFQDMEFKQRQVEQRINQAFMVDMFLMLASTQQRQKTATEVAELQEEKLLMIGPALEQLNEHVLDPLIDLVFDFMNRQGEIPEPPEQIQDLPLRVEYVSVMAQAQKLVGRAGLESSTAFTMQVASLRPEVLDKIDWDQMIDQYAEVMGIDPRIINADEEVAGVRQARAQAQAAQAAAEQAREVTGAVKDLATSPAPDEGGEQTVLSRIAEAAAEGAEEEAA